MFWAYTNTATVPTLVEVAEIAKIVGGKVSLAKIGVLGSATFGSVGWPLIVTGALGYGAWRLFKLADQMPAPTEE